MHVPFKREPLDDVLLLRPEACTVLLTGSDTAGYVGIYRELSEAMFRDAGVGQVDSHGKHSRGYAAVDVSILICMSD